MKPVFQIIMYSDCETVHGEKTTCIYSVSLYPDLSFKVKHCGDVISNGEITLPKYGAQQILRPFEERLQRIINEHSNKKG
jgi:hypothetical protein